MNSPTFSTLSNSNNNSSNLTSSSTPYDFAFVEALKNFDPSEVTSDFLEAANQALIEQEKQRKKWQKQQQDYHHQQQQEEAQNDAEQQQQSYIDDNNTTTTDHNQQSMQDNNNNNNTVTQSKVDNNDDDDASSSSSSSSFLSSDIDDNDDRNERKTDPEGEESAQSNDDVATAFARSFLAPDGAVEHFVGDVRDTARTLQSLRSTIRRFSRKMEGVTSEVGILQKKARQTEISLVNNHNVKQFTSVATELLVPSIDMVRILLNQFSPSNTHTNFTILQNNDATLKSHTSSDLPELGRQYLHSVRSLEKLILARQSHVISVLQTVSNNSGSNNSGSIVNNFDENDDEKGSGVNENNNNTNSQQQQRHQFVSIPFRDIPNLDIPSRRVVEALARQTCLQVRNFLTPRVAAVIGKPKTNIAIQQRSALLPYRILVSFLRTCATSPDLLPSSSNNNNNSSSASVAEVATAFYDELRATYIHFASLVYGTNFAIYVSECLSLQQKTSVVQHHNHQAAAAQQHQHQDLIRNTVSAHHHNNQHSSSWLDTATSWFSTTTPQQAATPSPARSHISSASSSQQQQQVLLNNEHHQPSFPSLADTSQTLLPNEFSKRISSSASLIMNLHKLTSGTPILPLVQRQQNKFHSPIETFRSVNMLLCDVVTSEFLFTFEFFDGDTSIYDRVFRTVVDSLIQFVMQNFIPTSAPSFAGTHHRPSSTSSSSSIAMKEKSCLSPTDVVSLGVLSMSAVTFRNQMRLRGLHCLDEYFSHVLTLFLPCMKRALEAQYTVIRNELLQASSTTGLETLAKSCGVSPQQLSILLNTKNNSNNNNASSSSKTLRLSLLPKLHPICQRFAHLSFSLRSIFVRMSIQYLMDEKNFDNNNKDNNNKNIFLSSKLSGLASSLGGGQRKKDNNNNNSSSHHNDEDEYDDSDEMISVMCATFKAMCLDFIEWMKRFSQEDLCGGDSVFTTGNQQQLMDNQQQQQQQLPIPSVFMLNNVARIFETWFDLGSPAKIKNQSDDNNDKQDDGATNKRDGNDNNDDLLDLDDFEQFQRMEEKERNKNEDNDDHYCILQEVISGIDQDFHQEYENALDEFSYEILKVYMGNVISAIQDAEMKIIEITQSHERQEEDDDSYSDEEEGEEHDTENENEKKESEKEKEPPLTITSIPSELEAACRWFIDNAQNVLTNVSQYCKSSLVDIKPKQINNNNNNNNNSLQVSPLTDAMKRTFTQLLLWNTRMHTTLGKLFSLITLFTQHQQKTTAATANAAAMTASSSTVVNIATTNSSSSAVITNTMGTGKNQQRFRALTVSNVQLTQWMQQQV